MNRRLIPAHELHAGQRVFVKPLTPDLPRGPGLSAFPVEGSAATVGDYLFGCAQRGALLAFELLPDPEPAAESEVNS